MLVSFRPPAATHRRITRLWLLVIWLAVWPASSRASDVLLQNGFVLTGSAGKVPGLTSPSIQRRLQAVEDETRAAFPYVVVDDGVRRFIVHRHSVVSITGVEQFSSARVSYEIEQLRQARAAGFGIIGRAQMEPFNDNGRRTIRLQTRKGETPVIQAITQLDSSSATVVALTHNWEMKVDTSSIPESVLRSLLARAEGMDLNDPRERMAIVTFYTQARMYDAAQRELKDIQKQFPDLVASTTSLRTVLGEFIGAQALGEIKLRRLAGQHELASNISRRFPQDDISVEVLREAQAVAAEYDAFLEQRELVSLQLDTLQASLPMDQAQQLTSLRSKLESELGIESLPRLAPFLRSVDDDTLAPAEKLALAYSGWLLGSEHALTKLDEAIELWGARFQVLEYLRESSDTGRDVEILSRLRNMEGLNPQRLAWMIPNLPLAGETPPAQAAIPLEVTVPTNPQQTATRYTIVLPPEYSPLHRYPLLVALRPEGMRYSSATALWAGTAERPGWAQRRGYIVISPDYYAADAGQFYPSDAVDEVVLRCIDHVRQHWRVDSDRIFLAGHGMGADACFQLGMAHPGVFAGCIPLGGACDDLCRYYWANSSEQSWYVVAGQRETNNLDRNGTLLESMMDKGRQDVVYCEYQDRGTEPWFEEQERIFQWMEPLRRPSLSAVSKWAAKSVRRCDNRFHWLRADAIPERQFAPIPWSAPERPAPRTAEFSGEVKATGAIRVSFPGDRATLWLSPELANFNERCEVLRGAKTLFREFVQPSIEVMLSELREHGDRERLWWARIELK